MLTNNKIKYIKSLEHKKYRKQHQVFVVEGEKMVLELLNSQYIIHELFVSQSFLEKHQAMVPANFAPIVVSETELKKASFLQTATQALAIAGIKSQTFNKPQTEELVLGLDHIQDPGNLGTIIRTALWFGVKKIFCSPDTVDVYNPKVIQSTMGAIFHVDLYYTELESLIHAYKQAQIPIYGTLLQGKNLYAKNLTKGGLLLMGNESKGLSEKLSQQVDQALLIPPFPAESEQMESLNVSIATALVLAEFRRQTLKPEN